MHGPICSTEFKAIIHKPKDLKGAVYLCHKLLAREQSPSGYENINIYHFKAHDLEIRLI